MSRPAAKFTVDVVGGVPNTGRPSRTRRQSGPTAVTFNAAAVTSAGTPPVAATFTRSTPSAARRPVPPCPERVSARRSGSTGVSRTWPAGWGRWGIRRTDGDGEAVVAVRAVRAEAGRRRAEPGGPDLDRVPATRARCGRTWADQSTPVVPGAARRDRPPSGCSRRRLLPCSLRIVTDANRSDTVDDGVTRASMLPAGHSTANTSTASFAPDGTRQSRRSRRVASRSAAESP